MPKLIEPILPPDGMPWARQTDARLAELADTQARSLMEQVATNQGLAASLDALSRQINLIPLQNTNVTRATGFALSSAATNKVSATIAVPSGKTKATVLVIGTGAAIDATTGGITTAYGRIVIAGVPSGESPAAKDAGASAVNNVITATGASTFNVTPGSTFTVAMQMYGLNGAAFPASPDNFAQIATIATFTP